MSDRSRYVQPEVSEARVNRLWANVAERLEPRQSRAWRWVFVSTALVGVAAATMVLARGSFSPISGRTGTEHALLSDSKLETGAEPLSVTLGDGSSVKLSSRSELAVRGSQSSSVSLALGR